MAMNSVTILDNSDGTSGLNMKQKGTDGAGHVYGLARNGQIVTAGTTSVEFFGFLCLVTTDGTTAITPKGDSATPITGIVAGAFVAGQVYPIHGTSVTIQAATAGSFLLFTADA